MLGRVPPLNVVVQLPVYDMTGSVSSKVTVEVVSGISRQSVRSVLQKDCGEASLRGRAEK